MFGISELEIVPILVEGKNGTAGLAFLRESFVVLKNLRKDSTLARGLFCGLNTVLAAKGNV